MPKRTPRKIIDTRTRNSAKTISGITLSTPASVSDHGLLLGLGDDDHSQYLLASGGRTLTGNLAASAGVTIDGIDISAHAANPDAHHATATAGNSAISVAGQAISLAAAAAGAGLSYAAGVLAVGAGSGLTVNADDVALTTPGALSVATSSSAAGNHTHAVSSSSNPGASPSLLASDNGGYLTLVRFVATERIRTPLIDTASGNLSVAPAGTLVVLAAGKGVRSNSYASGFAGNGWQIDDAITVTGRTSAEFDDLTIRGRMSVYELLIRQIRATNGSIFVSSTGKAKTVTDNGGGSYTIVTETDHGFLENDLIRAQRFTGTGVYQSDLTVTSVASTTQFTATLRGGYTAPAAGMEYVRLGNTTDASRRGTIYMTADDSGAPFMDVVDGVAAFGDWNTAGKIRTRIGRLTGITGTPNEYGIIAGTGFTAADSYFKASNSGVALTNVALELYEGGSKSVSIAPSSGIAIHGYAPGNYSRSITFYESNALRAGIGLGINGNLLGIYKYASGSLYLQAISANATKFATVQIEATDGGSKLDLSADAITFNGNAMWHAGNDGSGSGLDADLLDGSHASAFALLAGATFTGDVGLSQAGINNDTSDTMMSFNGGSDGTLGGLLISIGVHPSATGANRYAYIGVGDNSAMRPLALNANGAGAFGRVGIGTVAPAAELDVAGYILASGVGYDWSALTPGGGWNNYGSGNATFGVKRFGNLVSIKGVLSASGTIASDTSIYTLASEYRPATIRQFICYGSPGAVRVLIASDGTIRPQAAFSSGNYLSVEITYFTGG